MTEIAQLMPNGEQTFVDANGVPLSGGKVFMYIPNTSTFKNTWIDQGETTLNTNPIVLDAAGRCIIYGNGQYRQYVTDQFANLIWDQLTNWVPPGSMLTSYYDLPIYIQGEPSNSEVFPIFNAVRNTQLPVGLAGSVFTIATLPTATTTFTLAKNGSNIGTVSFSTLGVPTVTFVSAVSFSSGDQLTITAQASADATAANIAMTIVWTVL